MCDLLRAREGWGHTHIHCKASMSKPHAQPYAHRHKCTHREQHERAHAFQISKLLRGSRFHGFVQVLFQVCMPWSPGKNLTYTGPYGFTSLLKFIVLVVSRLNYRLFTNWAKIYLLVLYSLPPSYILSSSIDWPIPGMDWSLKPVDCAQPQTKEVGARLHPLQISQKRNKYHQPLLSAMITLSSPILMTWLCLNISK